MTRRIRSRVLVLLFLASFAGESFAQMGENLALEKEATQSSTLGGSHAALAVDGQRGNFTSTLPNAELPDPAWWQVDLGESFQIGMITLWNRSSFLTGGSRLRDIIVQVLAEDGETVVFQTTDPANPDPAKLLNPENTLGEYPNGPESLVLDLGNQDIEGRFVKIYRIPDEDLSGSGGLGTVLEATTLSLAEVEVFGSGGEGCPEEGDSHCEGIDVVPPLGGEIVGSWSFTVDAFDDSDDLLTYSFIATHEDGATIRRSETIPSTTFQLSIPGQWTVSASVDDDPFCLDVAEDAVCEETFVVEPLPGLTDTTGLFLTKAFLVLGPFRHSFGCGPDAAGNLLRNHIANARIECEYPMEGDIVDYDASAAATTAYIGPEEDGVPSWRAFDDGSLDNGDQDLNGDIGARDDVMSWLVTYVEYHGNSPTEITLCLGSDDGGQVYWDGERVLSDPSCRGRGDCDVQSELIVVEPGIHRIAAAAWNRGGGWGLRLSLDDAAFQKITDDPELFPEWEFHGRTPPEHFEPPECPEESCQPEPVRNLVCDRGEEDLTLTWENPPITDPETPTIIEAEDIFGGLVEIAAVESDETTVTIELEELPDDFTLVRVTHCGGVPATCSPFKTDSFGGILSENFLVLGPFEHPFRCNGPTANLRRNHIAPTEIFCLYPEFGEEVPYDAELAATTGYLGPTGENGMPTVRRFDDGGAPNGDHDLNRDLGQMNDVMSWLFTYVEYKGAAPVALEICFGSGDGGQLWVNGDELITTSKCRARADCQERAIVELDGPTVLRIAAGAWNSGGAWGVRLQFFEDGLPLVDSLESDWVFHGTRKPEGFVSPCEGVSRFIRGDTTADGQLNLTDAVGIFGVLFLGDPMPSCVETMDANDDDQVNLTDGIVILGFLFLGSTPPASPFPECGLAPGGGPMVDCENYPPCQ